jgi:hypothetical protein
MATKKGGKKSGKKGSAKKTRKGGAKKAAKKHSYGYAGFGSAYRDSSG